MNTGDAASVRRRAVALAAAAALSLWPLFASTPVSHAEPYADDGEGSSYNEAGGSYGGADEGAEHGTQEASGDTGYGGTDQGAGAEQGGGTDQGDGVEQGGNGYAGGADGTEQGGRPTGESGYGAGAEGTDPAGGYGGGSGIIQPTELDADPSDVAAATSSGVVEVSSTETSREEIGSYLESIESTSTNPTGRDAKTLNSPVSQWNSQWIRYDRNYRPVFVNPYFSPMQVVYQHGGKTQGFTVAPQQQAALNVPDPGLYSFTAFTRPASGPVSNISVGSFSGGGYLPAPGQAPPQKPATAPTVRNPIVQVQFAQGSSEPFRVGTLVDLGKDPSVKGATKVLLDGEVPAWGQWSKSEAGEPQFNITETQLLPGLKPPGQDPLPGYQVTLTAASHATPWYMGTRTHILGAAVAAGVLALAAIALVLVRQRRVEE